MDNSNKPQVLLIVEGEVLEPCFFSQLANAFKLNVEFCCVKSNIYLIYKKMEELGFLGNIKDVLIEIDSSEENISKLSKNFAFTFLVFDFDAHHTELNEKDIPLECIVQRNIHRLHQMANYFVDETDPTIGKLYINYPMMESFKDCDSFDDENFIFQNVSMHDFSRYKSLVGRKKMANKRIDNLTANDFIDISILNVKKLNYMLNDCIGTMTYSSFQQLADQDNILKNQELRCSNSKEIAVLNTSIYFLLDYYGNKNNFYDNIMFP